MTPPCCERVAVIWKNAEAAPRERAPGGARGVRWIYPPDEYSITCLNPDEELRRSNFLASGGVNRVRVSAIIKT